MFRQAMLVLVFFLVKRLISIPLTFDKNEDDDFEDEVKDSCISYKCTCIYTPSIAQRTTPILLLHGLGGSIRDWDNIFDSMASQTGRRVCAIDFRNHGDSCWNNDTDIAALTSDVEQFMNSQGMVKVNLIGHSLGGKVAVHFALNFPERVSSVTVEDMKPNGITSEALVFIKMLMDIYGDAMSKVSSGANEGKAKQTIANYYNDKMKQLGLQFRMDNASAEKLQVHCLEEKCDWKTNFSLLRKVITKNPEDYLTESKGLYEGLALFIFGMKSPFKVNDSQTEITKLFLNAKFVPVKEAGHSIHAEFPDIFLAEVLKFLNNVS